MLIIKLADQLIYIKLINPFIKYFINFKIQNNYIYRITYINEF